MMALNNKKGISVIEVLISIGMAGVMIVSIGMSMSAIQRLNKSSSYKEQALAYAKESIETITEQQQTLFGCDTTAGPCSCSPLPGYTSCWVDNPAVASEGQIPNTVFTKKVTVENIAGDLNRKKITTEISWTEKNNTKTTRFSTIITAWKNI